MTQHTLTSLLVGAHFRPPAKCLLSHLPAGASMLLDPEPDNPYDEAAIKVCVSPSELPESSYPSLEVELPAFGTDLVTVLAGENWHLGYVAAPKNKGLVNRLDLVSNIKFLETMATKQDWSATLAFDADGQPLICLAVSNE